MTKKNKKVIIVMPALDAEKTIEAVVRKIPKGCFDKLILIDDASKDKTYEKSVGLGIESFKNVIRMGYGGNLKLCLLRALAEGADIIVELHPDGEYDSSAIIPAIKKINEGADFILGNRFTSLYSATLSGMPLWKYIPSRVLSFISGLVLNIKITDLHQGFRVYTKRFLESVDFTLDSNNYLFSFEIIAKAVFRKMKIAEVPVKCKYTGKKRGASLKNSILYSMGVFKVIFYFWLSKLNTNSEVLFKKRIKNINCAICNNDNFIFEKYKTKDFVTGEIFNIFYCMFCENGFTYPVPQNFKKYYPASYFGNNNALVNIRKYAYLFLEKRRIKIIQEYRRKAAKILDVGAGEGYIGKLFEKSGFVYKGIDAVFADLKNKNIIKADFISYFDKDRYDIVSFWESLEHFDKVVSYLRKAKKLLKKDGIIAIEVPRFDSLESSFFGSRWYHLSAPRHLSHFTRCGLERILTLSGYKVIREKNVLALEYVVWGFMQSFFNFFRPQDEATAVFLKEHTFKKISYLLLSCFLMPLAFIAEIFLYILGFSPIMLFIASKND